MSVLAVYVAVAVDVDVDATSRYSSRCSSSKVLVFHYPVCTVGVYDTRIAHVDSFAATLIDATAARAAATNTAADAATAAITATSAATTATTYYIYYYY